MTWPLGWHYAGRPPEVQHHNAAGLLARLVMFVAVMAVLGVASCIAGTVIGGHAGPPTRTIPEVPR